MGQNLESKERERDSQREREREREVQTQTGSLPTESSFNHDETLSSHCLYCTKDRG